MGRRAGPRPRSQPRRRREGQGLGVGEENQRRDGAGEGQEVGHGLGWQQEDGGGSGQKGEAAVADALRLLLVADAPSQVGQLRVSTQLLQGHAAKRVAVGWLMQLQVDGGIVFPPNPKGTASAHL